MNWSRADVKVINVTYGQAWLMISTILFSTQHWIGATAALAMGIWMVV